MIWGLNIIVNKFAEIAASHMELKSFGYGAVPDIDSQLQSNALFTQLWVEPLSSQLVFNKGGVVNQRRYAIYCYDLIRQDEKNIISTWNNTELILIDIIKLLKYDSVDYRIVNDPILTPFSERFADNVTGYMTEIILETPESSGTCDIPILDIIYKNGYWNDWSVWVDLDLIRLGP